MKYSSTALIRTTVIRPIIRIVLALAINLSRILQDCLALQLPVIGSSTVECYGFQNFKSGVVERFRRSYIL